MYIAVPVISWCSRSITCKGRSKKHCKRGREVGKTWHQNSDACRHITHCTKHQKKIHLFWGIAHYLVFLHYFSNFKTLPWPHEGKSTLRKWLVPKRKSRRLKIIESIWVSVGLLGWYCWLWLGDTKLVPIFGHLHHEMYFTIKNQL